jgi:hypothetical protein
MTDLPGYFTKIEDFIKLDLDDFNKLELGDKIEHYVGSGTLLEYYCFKDVKQVTSLITRRFCKIEPTYVTYAQITGKGLLGAHIDHGPLVNLNYYISAEEDETVFLKKKQGDVKGKIYPGKDEAKVFDLKDLDEVGRFVSKSNEAYLLNVSEIHCVNKLVDTKRAFISFSWHHNTYQEVLDNLI